MDIDDLGTLLFENNDDRLSVATEINKLETTMIELFNDLDFGKTEKGDLNYFGFNLTDGDEYGIILNDSKDINKCFVSAHDVLEGLRIRICSKCSFTVSIGYSRIIEDDLGMPDDLFERVNKHLKQAKKNGKNMIHFGQKKDLLSDIIDIDSKNDNNDNEQSRMNKLNRIHSLDDQDDKIQMQSVQQIEVCGTCCLLS